jgi:CheY-like chemotaxis protein
MPQKINSVLLVDDNPLTNIFNKKILEKNTVVQEIVTVNDGTEAIEYLTLSGNFTDSSRMYHPPDLIMLDLTMPGMDGWDFLDEYSRIKSLKKTVIIILTSSPNPEDERKARAYHDVDDFYVKPITAEKLEKIMTTHFQ